jgi:hypothetical protein
MGGIEDFSVNGHARANVACSTVRGRATVHHDVSDSGQRRSERPQIAMKS